MCGIAGVVDWARAGDPGARRARLERQAQAMALTLEHRGPDRTSTWSDDRGLVAFGHTRLRVIDLETGGQPMVDPETNAAVVFNGEIYNFRSLRRELEAGGSRFRTASDTEVLLHGYRAWGTDLPRRLDGMFALALWDPGEGSLFLARDRAGKKPMFVYRDERRLAFASEIKALRALPDVDLDLDDGAVPRYLLFGYVPSPGTFHARVRKHAPATWTRVYETGEQSERYWSLSWTSGSTARPVAVNAVREAVTAAVESRLVSDVPLGAFLSGGLDSSVIVALMTRAASSPVRTFSIGFEGAPDYDETSYARLVADHIGTDHTEFIVDPSSLDLVDELLQAYDEPFGDSSAIPTWLVSRATGDHVTVALTGDGGDEMFAGYPRFLGQQIATALPRPLALLGRTVGGWLPQAAGVRSLTGRVTRFADAASLDEAERLLRWIGFFSGDLDEILRPEMAVDAAPRTEWLESFRAPLRKHAGASVLTRTLALNFETYLLDDLLVKADRCSMAHGLEVRSPFLDTGVMELAAALPDGLRIRWGTLKWVLRQAFRDLLPAPVLTRPKMGFGIPLPHWLRGPWREAVLDRLGHGARILQWVRADALEALLEAHMSGRRDYGHRIWSLLTLEAWLASQPGRSTGARVTN